MLSGNRKKEQKCYNYIKSPFNRTERKTGDFMITDNLDLKLLLESKKITKKELANRIGVTPTTVTRWFMNPNMNVTVRNRIINAVSQIETVRNQG